MTNNDDQSKDKKLKAIDETILLAFQMKFKGFTYEQMAERIPYTVRTLQLYFTKTGRWHDDYVSWRQARIEELTDQLDNMFLAQALDSAQQIANISKGRLAVEVTGPDGKSTMMPIGVKGDTVLRAAQDILDRAGFKPKEKVEVSDPQDHADKLFDWFKKRGKPVDNAENES